MILLINKPKHFTSFDVVAITRKALFKKYNKRVKVGHAGTLDPLATGLLIVLTEKDTKLQNRFMNYKKTYIAEFLIGASSDTYDLEGEVVISPSEKLKSFNLKKLEEFENNYVGKVYQTVPKFSAVKIDGKRLYKLARSGANLKDKLPLREVIIYKFIRRGISDISFLNTKLKLLQYEIECSKGTYIRSIANDLGKYLGTKALLYNLNRIKIGKYKVSDAIEISSIDNYI